MLCEADNLSIETLYLLRIVLQPSGLGLVMGKKGIRGINHPLPKGTNLQAKIHIIKGHRKLFPETAHLIKEGFLGH